MKTNILTFLIITLIIVFPGCIHNNTDSNDEYKLSYTISITAIDVINFTIILQLPNGWHDLLENMRINEGFCNMYESRINNSLAIKIIGNGTIELHNEKITNQKEDVYYDLPEHFNHTSKVYCEKVPIGGYLYLESIFNNIDIYDGKGGGWSIYGELSNGWQYINMEGGG